MLLNEQVRTSWGCHRWITAGVLVVMTLIMVSGVRASVGLVDFFAEVDEDEIFLFWETASETGNLGFYVERSTSGDSGFERIEVEIRDGFGYYIGTFIPSMDNSGALYEVVDIDARMGTRYYYRLQDVPHDGVSGVYTHPVSAMIVPDWQVVIPMVYKQ